MSEADSTTLALRAAELERDEAKEDFDDDARATIRAVGLPIERYDPEAVGIAIAGLNAAHKRWAAKEDRIKQLRRLMGI